MESYLSKPSPGCLPVVFYGDNLYGFVIDDLKENMMRKAIKVRPSDPGSISRYESCRSTILMTKFSSSEVNSSASSGPWRFS